jgi:hypothetical protein
VLGSLTRTSRHAKATGVSVRFKSGVTDSQPTTSKAATLDDSMSMLMTNLTDDCAGDSRRTL